MAAARTIVNGIVKDGVVIPQGGARLPEGAHVEIVLDRAAIPPELLAEFEAWERASDEAWAMIE